MHRAPWWIAIAAACSSKSAAPTPAPMPAATPPPTSVCHVVASGAVTADVTVPGELTSEHWTPAPSGNVQGSNGDVYGVMSGKLPDLAIDCKGSGIQLSIDVPGAPFGPGRYASPRDHVRVSGNTGSAVGTFFSSFAGTVDIAAFDRRHIAGELHGNDSLLGGRGSITLDATFDIACPAAAGCPP